MKFNSQICTTREQSEWLLSLGLKKETADMLLFRVKYKEGWSQWHPKTDAYSELGFYAIRQNSVEYLPAWSLHRLIEMALRDILICGISFTFNEDAYEKVIRIIEHQIKEGYFPKKYLEEKL